MKATRARQKQLLLLGSGRQRFSFLDPRCLGWVPGRAPFSQLTNRCEDSTMMGQGTVGEGKACNFTNPQWTIANQIAKLLTTLTSCFQVQLSVGIATSEKMQSGFACFNHILLPGMDRYKLVKCQHGINQSNKFPASEKKVKMNNQK